jgi:DNA-binding NarL/FixJ family response regulator
VVGSYPRVEDLLASRAPVDCEVVLLNSDTPPDDVVTIAGLSTDLPGRPGILVLTSNAGVEPFRASLRLGVQGYGIHQELRPDDIVGAIRTVVRGRSWACPKVTEMLVDLVRDWDGLDGSWRKRLPISERELDVLHLVAAGARELDIAQQLCVTRNTVKTYLRRIRTKLNVDSSLAAVRLAAAQGMISRPAEGERLQPAIAMPASNHDRRLSPGRCPR